MKPNLLLNTKCKTLAVAAAMLAFIARPTMIYMPIAYIPFSRIKMAD